VIYSQQDCVLYNQHTALVVFLFVKDFANPCFALQSCDLLVFCALLFDFCLTEIASLFAYTELALEQIVASFGRIIIFIYYFFLALSDPGGEVGCEDILEPDSVFLFDISQQNDFVFVVEVTFASEVLHLVLGKYICLFYYCRFDLLRLLSTFGLSGSHDFSDCSLFEKRVHFTNFITLEAFY